MTVFQVEQDPDGEYISYATRDPHSIQQFCGEGGVKFPCPIPSHPERLNDMGMLRMLVTLRLSYTGVCVCVCAL